MKNIIYHLLLALLSLNGFTEINPGLSNATWSINSESNDFFQMEIKLIKNNKNIKICINDEKGHGLKVIILDDKNLPYFYSNNEENFIVFYDPDQNKFIRINNTFLKLDVKVLKNKEMTLGWFFEKEKVKNNLTVDFKDILTIFNENKEKVKNNNDSSSELLTDDGRNITINIKDSMLTSIILDNLNQHKIIQFNNIIFSKDKAEKFSGNVEIRNTSEIQDIVPETLNNLFSKSFAYLLSNTLGAKK